MKKKQKRSAMVIFGIVVALTVLGAAGSQFFSSSDETIAVSEQPAAGTASGKETMIDLGAGECIPCKMMAPMIKALKKEYAGRADIIFIDVWKNPAEEKSTVSAPSRPRSFSTPRAGRCTAIRFLWKKSGLWKF